MNIFMDKLSVLSRNAECCIDNNFKAAQVFSNVLDQLQG